MKKKILLLIFLNIILALLIACENRAGISQLKGHVNLINSESAIEKNTISDSSNITSNELLSEQEPTLNKEEIIVEFIAEIDKEEKSSFKAENKLTKVRKIKGLDLKLYRLEEDLNEEEFMELLEAVREEEIVKTVKSNYRIGLEGELIETESNGAKKQWNHPQISLPLVWDKDNTGSSDVTVAVLDTGIDSSHPDLKEQVVPGKSYIEPESEAEDSDYELGYIDDHGHGTHVAGIIGADNNGNDDNDEIKGVSWDSKLMPVKVLDSRGAGKIADIISGIRWAADEGADIINLSLGSTLGLGDNLYQAAIDYADEQGAILVSSSGNSNDIKVGHPARYENAIAVGAITEEKKRWSDGNNGSNYGEELDIMAPGKDIYSTLSQDVNNNKFDFMTGTSMASPHVAGVIALMLAEEPRLETDEIRRRLIMSAEDAGQKGEDLEYGYGIINSYAAVYGAERDQVKVFLGEKKNNLIQAEKGPKTPNHDGFFDFEIPEGESYSLYAWVDITDSGSIETGDYFASYELAVGGGFNYNLELEVMTEDFSETDVVFKED